MVLVPILAIGVLAFRLIDQTTSGRAGARASGLVTAASGIYTADERSARSDAQAVGVAIAGLPAAEVRARIALDAAGAGLTRVLVRRNGQTIADIGSAGAVAPGSVTITSGSTTTTVIASLVTARQFVTMVAGPLSGAVLSQDGRLLASSVQADLPSLPLPAQLKVGHTTYATNASSHLMGFNGRPLTLTALSDMSASASSTSDSDLIALAFLGGFALLSFGFAVLASRGMNEMVKRFLAAATRLADRDFSARVPVEGHDEFAKLATEFNRMSDQLEGYIAALDAERQRLRESIRRTGETFASSLDRNHLAAITVETANAGLEAGFGRMTWRDEETGPLHVVHSAGPVREAGQLVLDAERRALNQESFAEASGGELHVMAARMGSTPHHGRAYGTLMIGRRGPAFRDDDRDLFRSLAAQAWRALDNVRLHDEADRKAVTDLLTGLANHGRFQAVLASEMEDARRYGYPVSLILFDLDNFKRINDSYGHPQGDQVLRCVSQVLAQSTREGETAARYGGEEMALILPHTDLEGSFTIAERIRCEIEAMTIPMLDGSGELKVTASIGVAAASGGEKEELIAEADSALYTAKRAGKNQTVRAEAVASSDSTGSFNPEKLCWGG